MNDISAQLDLFKAPGPRRPFHDPQEDAYPVLPPQSSASYHVVLERTLLRLELVSEYFSDLLENASEDYYAYKPKDDDEEHEFSDQIWALEEVNELASTLRRHWPGLRA